MDKKIDKYDILNSIKSDMSRISVIGADNAIILANMARTLVVLEKLIQTEDENVKKIIDEYRDKETANKTDKADA